MVLIQRLAATVVSAHVLLGSTFGSSTTITNPDLHANLLSFAGLHYCNSQGSDSNVANRFHQLALD